MARRSYKSSATRASFLAGLRAGSRGSYARKYAGKRRTYGSKGYKKRFVKRYY